MSSKTDLWKQKASDSGIYQNEQRPLQHVRTHFHFG